MALGSSNDDHRREQTFNPTDMGGYDISGTYFPASTAVVTNGVEVENAFATFSAAATQYRATA